MIVLLTLVSFKISVSSLVSNAIAIALGIIFMAYMVIETQLIMGNKKHSLTLDNYTLGAVFLYVNVIGLFLSLLRLFGNRRI